MRGTILIAVLFFYVYVCIKAEVLYYNVQNDARCAKTPPVCLFMDPTLWTPQTKPGSEAQVIVNSSAPIQIIINQLPWPSLFQIQSLTIAGNAKVSLESQTPNGFNIVTLDNSTFQISGMANYSYASYYQNDSSTFVSNTTWGWFGASRYFVSPNAKIEVYQGSVVFQVASTNTTMIDSISVFHGSLNIYSAPILVNNLFIAAGGGLGVYEGITPLNGTIYGSVDNLVTNDTSVIHFNGPQAKVSNGQFAGKARIFYNSDFIDASQSTLTIGPEAKVVVTATSNGTYIFGPIYSSDSDLPTITFESSAENKYPATVTIGTTSASYTTCNLILIGNYILVGSYWFYIGTVKLEGNLTIIANGLIINPATLLPDETNLIVPTGAHIIFYDVDLELSSLAWLKWDVGSRIDLCNSSLDLGANFTLDGRRSIITSNQAKGYTLQQCNWANIKADNLLIAADSQLAFGHSTTTTIKGNVAVEGTLNLIISGPVYYSPDYVNVTVTGDLNIYETAFVLIPYQGTVPQTIQVVGFIDVQEQLHLGGNLTVEAFIWKQNAPFSVPLMKAGSISGNVQHFSPEGYMDYGVNMTYSLSKQEVIMHIQMN